MPDLFALPTLLLERFTTLGVDVPRLLRDSGIARSRFADGKARLTTREYLGVWRALEAQGGWEVGLRLADSALSHQLDVATTAAQHAANFGEALAKKARYKRLCSPEEITVDIADGEASVRFHWVRAEGDLPLLLVDTTFASALSLARRGTGTRVVPNRLELARRRTPADETRLGRHFGCQLQFDAPVDRIVFDARALALPFVTHNADLVAVLAPGLEAALASSAHARTLADDVRLALRRKMCGERPSVDKLAADLHLSARTLQRRLGELGTSYQALLDDVRHETARTLLSSTNLDVGEVAFVLGFEELSSFARAFHGWEGAAI